MARKETNSTLLIKTPDQSAGVDIQDDEHRGVGGSYVFDPVSGKRTRIEEPASEETNVGADHIRPADVTEKEKADEI